ncbi:hypothetical protein K0M31_018210, partial [Melipona bicolor]
RELPANDHEDEDEDYDDDDDDDDERRRRRTTTTTVNRHNEISYLTRTLLAYLLDDVLRSISNRSGSRANE